MSLRAHDEVLRDWESATLNVGTLDILHHAAEHILESYKRYEVVGKTFDIPPWVIGAIHYREASFDFTTWLANGDPLLRHGKPASTVHVPIGLGPASSWENAAEISLVKMKWHAGMAWDLVSALQRLESYNGMGYYHRGMPSPYIWAGTNHYHTGLFTSDGHFDMVARDKRVGCAAIALELKNRGIEINLIKQV